jgi:hypothetical protein
VPAAIQSLLEARIMVDFFKSAQAASMASHPGSGGDDISQHTLDGLVTSQPAVRPQQVVLGRQRETAIHIAVSCKLILPPDLLLCNANCYEGGAQSGIQSRTTLAAELVDGQAGCSAVSVGFQPAVQSSKLCE